MRAPTLFSWLAKVSVILDLWWARSPDDHDLRIPFILRGPGIPKGETSSAIVLNIDVAPTFSAIATGAVPAEMDGRNVLDVLSRGVEGAVWRSDFMVQYKGGFKEPCLLEQCPPPPKSNFHCIDGINNTYTCVRTIDADTKDSLYCEFVDSEGFIEFYNHTVDEHQLVNLWKSAPTPVLAELKQRLAMFRTCKGVGCRNL